MVEKDIKLPKIELLAALKVVQEKQKIKPRLTFLFPISERRKGAVGLLEKGEFDKDILYSLLTSKDFVEREFGYSVLSKARLTLDDADRFLPVIIKRVENGDSKEMGREQAIESLGYFGEESLPYLKKLEENGNDADIHNIITASCAIGEKAIPFLVNLARKNKLREKAVFEAISKISGDSAFEALVGMIPTNKSEKITTSLIIEKLGPFGEKTVSVLSKFYNSDSIEIREAVARACGEIGECSLEILEKMLSDKNNGTVVRIEVAKSLGTIGEKGLPLMTVFLQRASNTSEKEIIAANLGKMGKKAILPLSILVTDQVSGVKTAAISALSLIGGEDALNILKKIIETGSWVVKLAAIQAISNYGKEVIPYLDQIIEDDPSTARFYAYNSKSKILERSGIKTENHSDSIKPRSISAELLASRKPLFSTYPEVVFERISKLEKINAILKSKFKKGFIGLVAVGSTDKGYVRLGSDLDWGILVEDDEVVSYFKKLAKENGLRLCDDNILKVYGDEDVDWHSLLFCGLFFGDHERLSRIQLHCLESVSEECWDGMRREILEEEITLHKAIDRMGVDREEENKILWKVALLRVPPTREEAIGVLRKRVRKLKEIS